MVVYGTENKAPPGEFQAMGWVMLSKLLLFLSIGIVLHPLEKARAKDVTVSVIRLKAKNPHNSPLRIPAHSVHFPYDLSELPAALDYSSCHESILSRTGSHRCLPSPL